MQKEIEKAKDGYEKVVAVFDEVISTIEQAQNAEIEQIKAKYAERLNSYVSDRANYIVTEIIEVPDEPQIEVSENIF